MPFTDLTKKRKYCILIRNLFFDRDGIINEVIFRDSRVESPRTFSEFKIRQEFIEFYNKIIKTGFNSFIISNQPDVQRNKMDIKELEMMTDQLNYSFNFKEISYCLHDDSDNCNCRKPKPGMITKLLEKYNLLKDESIFIGDSIKDVKAGLNAGIKTVLLRTNYNLNSDIHADYRINNLTEILKIIQG